MKKMKIGAKITVGFSLLLLIMTALAAVSIYEMSMVEKSMARMSDQYVKEVDILSHLEPHTLRVMLNIRSYSMSQNSKYLELGSKELTKVKASLAEAQALAAKFPQLVVLKENTDQAAVKVAEYQKLIDRTVEANNHLSGLRGKMDEAAKVYMKNCHEFLDMQYEVIDGEIKAGASTSVLTERLTKIALIHEVIDMENEIRIWNFKSQATWNPSLIAKALASFDDMNKKLDALTPITRLQINLDHITATRAAADAYKRAMVDFLDTWKTVRELDESRTKVGDQLEALVMSTVEKGLSDTEKIASTNVNDLYMAMMMTLIGLLIALVVGALMAIFITLGITRPIKAVIAGLSQGSQQVAAASGQVSNASQLLAQGATEQAASLEETSSSLEEMSSMTHKNAENANQADTLAREAKDVLGRANRAMSELTTSMAEITQAGEETGKIIKTIDEIAFQTNLLALNAAVEAARAGEAGAGFAVVADEVRNLAMRAAEAAKNTANLLEGTINKTKQGSELVARTNDAFLAVVENSEKVGGLISEIAAASGEQAQGIGHINTAATEMDKVTQNNAASAEESAAAAEQLSAQAETMRGYVNDLSDLVGQGGPGDQKSKRRLDMGGDKKGISSGPLQLPAGFKKEMPPPSGRADLADEDSFQDF